MVTVQGRVGTYEPRLLGLNQGSVRRVLPFAGYCVRPVGSRYRDHASRNRAGHNSQVPVRDDGSERRRCPHADCGAGEDVDLQAVHSSDGKKISDVAAFARGTDNSVTEMPAGIGGFSGLGETVSN